MFVFLVMGRAVICGTRLTAAGELRNKKAVFLALHAPDRAHNQNIGSKPLDKSSLHVVVQCYFLPGFQQYERAHVHKTARHRNASIQCLFKKLGVIILCLTIVPTSFCLKPQSTFVTQARNSANAGYPESDSVNAHGLKPPFFLPGAVAYELRARYREMLERSLLSACTICTNAVLSLVPKGIQGERERVLIYWMNPSVQNGVGFLRKEKHL